ncbi:MAG: rRNA pseudouridine synthase [Candidatus Pacebacteria bacterium]|nr:rRNA pseudouridine synthase [Candidatus Paceibacterota bacterium]
MRINKFLAVNEYASRREADILIQEGKVFINNKRAKLGDEVRESDTITVEGARKTNRATYAFYKPKGIVTTGAQENEKEILNTTSFPEKVFPIGRLDKDSEGLIIMSNDGTLATKILGTGIEKEYSVTVDKTITHSFLIHMRNGVKIKIPTKSKGSKWYTTQKTKIRRTSPLTFDIVLTEGKNRQIRRMCAALGYHVEKLKRFRIGSINLDNLKKGEFREISSNTLL